MISNPTKEWITLFIWAVSIIVLAWLPNQQDFHIILPCLILAFGSYAYLCFKATDSFLKYILFFAVLIRLIIVPSFPNLSDDIYRFIWDGRLWQEQMNPYLFLPVDIVGEVSSLNQALLERLNSQKYFSIYPPIPQLTFWFSTMVSSGEMSIAAAVMKGMHCLFDIGSLVILWKLLDRFKLPQSRILFYALNPLIIIELIGNLHHEGIVIFFLVLMIWLLSYQRILLAGLSMAAAIATKILPILFCPLIFFYLKGRQRWVFFFATVISCILLFIPIITQPEILENILSSADLYLRKFEFNASIYYLYRGLGYLIYGYNLIHILGPVLMIITACSIMYIAFFKGSLVIKIQQLIPLMLLTYLCYVALSITVHPWYIALLIPLSLFTPYKSPLVWSGLIMLTYINYYFEPYNEILSVVFIEYSIVVAFFLWELTRLKRQVDTI